VRLASDAGEAKRLASARRSAFSALARVKPTTILEDATVPRSELAGMIRFIQETAERHRLEIATFGHFGDGNLHPTFLTDERDADEMRRVDLAMREIFGHALFLGGTITGEHGVGLAKKLFLKASSARRALISSGGSSGRSTRGTSSIPERSSTRERGAEPPQVDGLLGAAAVHALRPLPSHLPHLP
jgi:FAD/FMN-containing dehydrogenase